MDPNTPRKFQTAPRASRAIRSLKSLFALVLAVFIPLAAPTRAQQSAAGPVWQGILRNAAGAPIAGAKVRLASQSATSEAVTGADGQFRLSPLPAGQYHLTVESNGRKIEYAQPIDLAPAMPSAALTLSARGELSVGVLQQAASTGGEQLSSQAVSELP